MTDMATTPGATATHASGAMPAPSTSSKGTRILGAISLIGTALVLLFAFVISKPDAQLGESIRIMYVHVPTVTAAYLLMIINAGFCAVTLWKRSRFADTMAFATGQVGTLMLALTLITGALWGRVTWNAFWVWDARLTTAALLFLMYLGYLAVRSLGGPPEARMVRSSIVGIAAACLIPVVHKSVEWWDSLHQGQTVLGKLKPEVSGQQYTTLMLAMVVALCISAWLVLHRFRLSWLEDQLDDVGLDAALEARRSEAAGVAINVGGAK